MCKENSPRSDQKQSIHGVLTICLFSSANNLSLPKLDLLRSSSGIIHLRNSAVKELTNYWGITIVKIFQLIVT